MVGFGGEPVRSTDDLLNHLDGSAIGQEVQRAIGSCEPRVRVDDVEVRCDDAGRGRFDIDIAYTVLGTNARQNLVVPFYSIPGEED